MFERPHHQRIATLLQAFDADLLLQANCYFAGGTAIVLSLGEYRESLDVDFLCASNDGYRLLRNTVTQHGLGALLKTPIKHLRDVRADRYGIRTILEVDGVPIKVEMVSEGRIDIQGSLHDRFGVPTLCPQDMYAEKLLANADRGLDKSTMSRDMIDLAMMVDHWGDISSATWSKVKMAYGEHVVKAFRASLGLMQDRHYLRLCLQRMQMDERLLDLIPMVLEKCHAADGAPQ
jgi:hypothetical protein